MSETFECGKCSKEITSGVLSDTMNPENSFPVVCLECAKEEDELVKFNNSEHAQTLNREPSPSPSEGARELARLIEREQGNCCGDVLNITAEDLEQIVQAYSAQQTQSLREELAGLRFNLGMLYGWHVAGCGCWEGGNDKQWPSREAYIGDPLCTCGLRDAVGEQLVNIKQKWPVPEERGHPNP